MPGMGGAQTTVNDTAPAKRNVGSLKEERRTAPRTIGRAPNHRAAGDDAEQAIAPAKRQTVQARRVDDERIHAGDFEDPKQAFFPNTSALPAR